MEVTLAYAPIMEPEEDIPELNWNKSTITYVINNKTRVMNSIRSVVKAVYKSQLQLTDLEDIWSEVVQYLYRCSDYDIEKAMECSERNGSQTILTLEGYVNSNIKYCVKRYVSNMYTREKDIIKESVNDEDGRDGRILDMVADKESEGLYDEICYDAESALKSLESKRYRYGADIYLVLYVRYLTFNKQETYYRQVLDILGIARKELSELERKISYDEDILNTAKALSLEDRETAKNQIRRFVYSAKLIDRAIGCV